MQFYTGVDRLANAAETLASDGGRLTIFGLQIRAALDSLQR
jgi:hypothetical protein